MSQKIDRRTKRTQEALREALVDLLLVKNLDSITVRDLIKLADISRSTFYRNYLDKYDFYEQTMKGLLAGINAISLDLDDYEIRGTFYQRYFKYFFDNRVFFRAFVKNKKWPMFTNGIIAEGVNAYSQILMKHRQQIEEHMPYELFIQYLVTANVGFVTQCLDQDKSEDYTLRASQLSLLVNEGVLQAVCLKNQVKLPG